MPTATPAAAQPRTVRAVTVSTAASIASDGRGALTAPRWPGDRGGHVWPKDREVAATDGTRIRYTVRGAEDGPWLVMCAGFLCPDNFWMYLLPPLLDRYRALIVNYRSVGASEDPRHPGVLGLRVRARDYSIPLFAGDVAAAMAAEGVTDATVIGHSMGCQVALELWHQQRDRIAALALITGPYASPLRTFYGTGVGAHLFPVIYHGLPLVPRPLHRLLPKVLRMPPPLAVMLARWLRALGPRTPPEGMRPYFEHFANCDPVVMLRIARAMHRYDASGFLSDIDVPVLVVIGGRDTFTPPSIGEEFAARLPDCELVELPDATHGALLEYPDEIRDVLVDFLHRRLGHPPMPATGDAEAVVRHAAD